MAKTNANATKTPTSRDALAKALDELKEQRKTVQKNFKDALEKAYAAKREQTKALKEQRAALWAKYGVDMKAQKEQKAAARTKLREAAAKAKAEKDLIKAISKSGLSMEEVKEKLGI